MAYCLPNPSLPILRLRGFPYDLPLSKSFLINICISLYRPLNLSGPELAF
jgi:hypothetical protein